MALNLAVRSRISKGGPRGLRVAAFVSADAGQREGSGQGETARGGGRWAHDRVLQERGNGGDAPGLSCRIAAASRRPAGVAAGRAPNGSRDSGWTPSGPRRRRSSARAVPVNARGVPTPESFQRRRCSRQRRRCSNAGDVPVNAGGVPTPETFPSTPEAFQTVAGGRRRTATSGSRGPNRKHPGGGARGSGSRRLASLRDPLARG
jgi:hypothetical protein